MRIEHIGDATLILADCMDVMRDMPDKAYSLAIIDPPYGIGEKFRGGKSGKMQFNEVVEKGWDAVPKQEYFNELFRVSNNQIIWGGNYFELLPSRCWIIWDKLISEDFSLSMAEVAWTSFDEITKIFRMATPKDGTKIHPTQKPVALYKWLLSRYAKPGDTILDTHGGSGSSVIACMDSGHSITWIEKDEDYFNAALKRIEIAYQQPRLFDEPKPQPKPQELGL